MKRIQNENDRLRSKLKVQAGQLKARQHNSTREVIKALQGFVPPSAVELAGSVGLGDVQGLQVRMDDHSRVPG